MESKLRSFPDVIFTTWPLLLHFSLFNIFGGVFGVVIDLFYLRNFFLKWFHINSINRYSHFHIQSTSFQSMLEITFKCTAVGRLTSHKSVRKTSIQTFVYKNNIGRCRVVRTTFFPAYKILV